MDSRDLEYWQSMVGQKISRHGNSVGELLAAQSYKGTIWIDVRTNWGSEFSSCCPETYDVVLQNLLNWEQDGF